MNYKFLIILLLSLFIFSCETSVDYKINKKDFNFEKKYNNSGFALIYNDSFKKIKKLDDRSLEIYHKTLKKNSIIRITNPVNGKYLIAKVKSNKINFSNFYNSILSLRIAEELELDFNEPYVEILLIPKNSTFVAKKAKMFEEERTVAEKVPVDGIQINDLNLQTKKKKTVKEKNFSYSIKVADFYYKKTAEIMIEKIKKEALIRNLKIIRLSETKYRVLIGPFNDIKTLKDSFEKMDSLNFENLEILKYV